MYAGQGEVHVGCPLSNKHPSMSNWLNECTPCEVAMRQLIWIHNFMCGRCSYIFPSSFPKWPFSALRVFKTFATLRTFCFEGQAELGIDRFSLVLIIDSRLWELFSEAPSSGVKRKLDCVKETIGESVMAKHFHLESHRIFNKDPVD